MGLSLAYLSLHDSAFVFGCPERADSHFWVFYLLRVPVLRIAIVLLCLLLLLILISIELHSDNLRQKLFATLISF